MSWTATLVIAHAPNESPLDLRSSLAVEGRRILTWCPGRETPAGLKEADVVLVMPALAESTPDDTLPFEHAFDARTIVLALSARAAPWAGAVLHPQTAVKPIADRVGALLRLTTLEWECEQRRKTFQAVNGAKLDERPPKALPHVRVLHIGGPSPDFPHLQDTLRKHDIELRPVLRPSLALDEIENGLVDAVLLDGSISPQTVRELTVLLRRNSDLALAPVLVLDPKSKQPTGARAPSLISDVIPGDTDPTLVATRLEQLVSETRRRRAALALLKRARTRGKHDPRTGLSAAALLEAHLITHLEEFERSGRAVSAGLLRFSAQGVVPSESESQSVAEQVGGLVARLIRAEDMAAQMSQNAIAFVFPVTLEAAAQAALKRIAAVLTATRFHSPRDVEGIALDVEWSVVQPRPGQSRPDLWSQASEQLPNRSQSSGI